MHRQGGSSGSGQKLVRGIGQVVGEEWRPYARRRAKRRGMQEGKSGVTVTVGHPRVLGIPIPKTLVIWVSPVTQTLTQIAKIIREGDAHITVTAALFPSQ